MKNQDFHFDQQIRIDNIRCAGIVLNTESVLVMHRKKNGDEYYTFPGGHMQKGEKAEDTLVRELMEEAAIKVKNVKLAFEFKDYVKDIYDIYFLCDLESGIPTLGGEEAEKNNPNNSYELEWINFSEISDLNIFPKAAKEWVQETLVEKRNNFN